MALRVRWAVQVGGAGNVGRGMGGAVIVRAEMGRRGARRGRARRGVERSMLG